MKKTIKLVLVLLSSTCTFAQSPGALGTANLTGWWKPDGMSTGNVTGWTTSFPTGGSAISLTEAGAPYPQLLTNASNNASNYNKTLDFTANTTVATGSTSPLALSNTTALNLLNNSAAGNQGTFFGVYYLPAPIAIAGHMVMYRESTAASIDGIQFRTSLGGTNGRIAIRSNTNSAFASRDWTEEYRPSIVGYKGNRSGAATMTATKRSKVFTGGINSGTTGNVGLRFGAQYTTLPAYVGLYDGFLSEVLFFNVDLTNVQLSQVNTYLGVKYAITLDNTGGGTQGDYVATTGTTVWDADLNPTYHNNVIGLAREDNEALLQKQSHTFDDVTRVYLNTLQTTNAANTGSFSSVVSYLIAGSTTGNMCATAASNAEVPAGCGLYSRLAREWKVTKTNFTADFSMDVKLSPCGAPGSVTVSELRFLVDDDGDFSNGGTTCYYNGDGSGIVISYANPVVNVSGVTPAMIPNNSTMYFTIGSILAATPLPVELQTFDAIKGQGRKVDLVWTTASEQDNDFFTLEKSADAQTWEYLAGIDGAGNSNQVLDYNFVDHNPFVGMNYYRLKQTDFDGNFSYSDIRVVEFNADDYEVLVFPNPANEKLYISMQNDLLLKEILILDLQGRVINRIEGEINELSVGHLAHGAYMLSLNFVDGVVKNVSFVVE